MKIDYNYGILDDFKFWAGAKANAEMLTTNELLQVEEQLECLYPEGITEIELNDLFWFEFEWICDLIGLTYDVEKDEIVRD